MDTGAAKKSGGSPHLIWHHESGMAHIARSRRHPDAMRHDVDGRAWIGTGGFSHNERRDETGFE